MSEENQLITERKKKLEAWREKGLAGFAEKFDRTHTSAEAKAFCADAKLRDASDIMAGPKSESKICGRVLNFRDMGKLAFLRIRDVDGDFQICLTKNALEDDYKWFIKNIDLGDFIGFTGEFFITKHGEPTLLAASVDPLSKSLRPLPEKWAGITDRESCYRQRYLDLFSNEETFNRFKIRSEVVRLIREFMHEKKFTEVETRTLQSQAGGAMARVFETHHNALDHEFVLRISLEIEHKMLLAGRFERVYEIGKCFRNEGMDPSHLQEFTLMEWYAAYANLEDNMNWTQEMIQSVVKDATGTTKCMVLDKDDKPVEIDFAGKWPRVKFGDLLKKFAKVDMDKIDTEELRTMCIKKYDLPSKEANKMGRGNLLDHVYKKTARPTLIQPTFVMDYPTDLKPLARPNGDGTSDCYQLLVAGWEIVNSYGELINPVVQRKLLEDQSDAKEGGDEEAMEVDDEFLTAMEHGFPPMTGFGMGIDRLVALITGQPNLRDVVLFPLMKPEGSSSSDKPKTSKPKKKTSSNVLPDENSKRFIAVVNKKAEMGRILNALGHMTAGLVGGADAEEMCFLEYKDADGGMHPNISHFPFIVLKADNSNKIRKVREAALAQEIPFTDFTSTMTVGTSAEQQKATKESKEEDLEYLGLCLFGDTEELKKFTGKFSLYR